MPRIASFVLCFLATMLLARNAWAYIDPGITYALIQGLFAIMFGAVVGWVLRPWRYLKNLFQRDKKQAATPIETPGEESKRDAS